MIHINTSGLQPPAEWLQKSNRLTQRLINAQNDDERATIINNNNHIWAELKKFLLNFSHSKCWYSEAKDICSDYHIDHFRPKLQAKELNKDERPGYWWLAFDWRNYRIAGSICNCQHKGNDSETHGKSDYFPLKKGSYKAGNFNDDIRKEINYLLDPTNPDDPILITFDESGKAIPSETDGWNKERASVSIDLLHLNYYLLTDERKIVWQECRAYMLKAIKILDTLSKHDRNLNDDLEGQLIDDFDFMIEKIKKLISPEARLSSTAKACLMSSGYEWARNLVIH